MLEVFQLEITVNLMQCTRQCWVTTEDFIRTNEEVKNNYEQRMQFIYRIYLLLCWICD